MTRPGPIGLLLVDEDPFICTNLASALRRVFPPETVIRTAHTLREAKEWIAKEEFDGIIADRSLPDGSGTDLLRRLANRSAQRVTLILTSGQVTDLPDVAELLTEHQDVIFFEKPLRFPEVANMMRRQVLPPIIKEQTFRGLSLFDLIQAYGLARKSATLRLLTSDGQLGVVGLLKGELVHAAIGDVEGVEALVQMVHNRTGEIRVEKGCMSARQTIAIPTQQALIEVYRRMDEKGRERYYEADFAWTDLDIDELIDQGESPKES